MRLEVHAFTSRDNALEWGRNEIDAAAGKARARYLTVAPGQEATYSAKYADAKAYVEAGYPDDATLFPWVKLEAARTNVTFTQAAMRIKQMGDFWNYDVGPRIESTRMGGKDRLDGLTSISELLVSVRVSVKELEQI